MSSSSAGHNVHSDVKIWIEMIDCALSLWYFGWTPFEQNWNIIERALDLLGSIGVSRDISASARLSKSKPCGVSHCVGW